jgi:hypothetical protein
LLDRRTGEWKPFMDYEGQFTLLLDADGDNLVVLGNSGMIDLLRIQTPLLDVPR